MNNPKLDEILKLEELGLFEDAYQEYISLFSEENIDFEVWKHFYFFLWTSYEDATIEFYERIEAESQLQKLIQVGKLHFSELAEFNFIAGYTIGIFPYIYGEYHEWEEKGRDMLQYAFQIEPKNLIYEMLYLGCGRKLDSERYNKCLLEARPKGIEQYSGIGYLNTYFRQVLLHKS